MSNWHHSPVHRLTEKGAYIVTAATYKKELLFDKPEKLTLLRDTLLSLSEDYGWNLQSWAVLSNHYHFVTILSDHAKPLCNLIRHLHSVTARQINAIEKTPERKVWFQYWETQITYEKSYFARLNYVHNNPVRHGLVSCADQYEWCSAKWFKLYADSSFFRTVSSFKFDKVNVKDDF